MEMDVTNVLLAFFALISTIVTVVLAPLVKAKTTVEQQKVIDYWVNVGVRAAEQSPDCKDMLGKEKKQHVFELLTRLNLPIAPEILDAVVEAVVQVMKRDVLTAKE